MILHSGSSTVYNKMQLREFITAHILPNFRRANRITIFRHMHSSWERIVSKTIHHYLMSSYQPQETVFIANKTTELECLSMKTQINRRASNFTYSAFDVFNRKAINIQTKAGNPNLRHILKVLARSVGTAFVQYVKIAKQISHHAV